MIKYQNVHEDGILMKVLALNGSPLKTRGNTEVLLTEFLKGAREGGAKVEIIYLADLDIRPCLGKLVCWIKTPGKCCQKDDMVELLPKLATSDIWVFASPIYWDGVTGRVKNLMDRMLPLIQPKIELIDDHCRHALREGVKPGKIVLISTCGFFELDNFEPMIEHVKSVCKNIHREFAGALIRPHGALIKYSKEKNDAMDKILIAAREAGRELVNTGKISQDTFMRVSQELMARDKYIKMINTNFERLTAKKNENS